MIDAYEMLRIKENELTRIKKEIESLRIAADLLREPDDPHDSQYRRDDESPVVRSEAAAREREESSQEPAAASTETLFHSMGPQPSRLRSWLGRAVGE
jgi:hypothetical protein